MLSYKDVHYDHACLQHTARTADITSARLASGEMIGGAAGHCAMCSQLHCVGADDNRCICKNKLHLTGMSIQRIIGQTFRFTRKDLLQD